MGSDNGRSEAAKARAAPRRETGRAGPLPRRFAVLLLVAWAALVLVAVAALRLAGSSGGGWIEVGELEALIPSEHRSLGDRPLALLRVAPEPAAGDELDPEAVLAQAGFAIEEALPAARVPLAPPKTEITRWLDAHALYRLPLAEHGALAERLSDAQMLAAVQGLRARMSSPLFAVSGEQPRRDPLALHELDAGARGRLGHVDAPLGGTAAQAGASGDLLAASGDRALVQLASDRPLSELRDTITAALAQLPVELALVGPAARHEAAAGELAGHGRAAAIAALAAVILLVALGLRRAGPVLALGLGLAGAAAVLAWTLAGVSLLGFAPALLLLGAACQLSLARAPARLRGWSPALIAATALLPLVGSPYPLWQRWGLIWLLAYLALAVLLGLATPAWLELAGSRGAARRVLLSRRLPGVLRAAIAVMVLAACGAGLAMFGQLDYRSPARLPLADPEPAALDAELRTHFFDPTMIVYARSSAPTERERSEAAAVLDAASTDAAALASLVPTTAVRIDSPGSFVLAQAELERRGAALAGLELDARMAALDGLLRDHGLRAEAFSEFVDTAARVAVQPGAQAALDGPLGPWIAAYLDDSGGGLELRAAVELRGANGLPAGSLPARADGGPALRGPAVAAGQDRERFATRLGSLVLAGLWLVAFGTWLTTGRLGAALTVAAVAAASQGLTIVALAVAGATVGPELLPPLLLTGAIAGATGARACDEAEGGTLLVERSSLLAAACLIACAAALWTSGEPLWRELGRAATVGCTAAALLGTLAGALVGRPVTATQERA